MLGIYSTLLVADYINSTAISLNINGQFVPLYLFNPYFDSVTRGPISHKTNAIFSTLCVRFCIPEILVWQTYSWTTFWCAVIQLTGSDQTGWDSFLLEVVTFIFSITYCSSVQEILNNHIVFCIYVTTCANGKTIMAQL